MLILGCNAFHGDASAAVLRDGHLTACIEEERLNRIKHWAGFPSLAVGAVLNGEPAQHVAISRDPKAKLLKKFLRVATHPSHWTTISNRATNAAKLASLGQRLESCGINKDAQLHYVEHHRAHLASAFFCSPFEEAAVVSVDGFGDFSSVMWGIGRGNTIDVKGSVHFPHSMGLFYTAFTQYLGFPRYGDEYKMMGLAAYGQPRFAVQVREVMHVEGDQVRLNLDYFRHHNEGVAMTWNDCEPTIGDVYSDKMVETFGPARVPRTEMTQHTSDMAASVQLVLEENYFALLRYVQQQTGLKNLCLAGGVALNCAANGKIFEETPFTGLWVQPAANDSGTSIGAALYVWHQELGKPRDYVMRHASYGPEYTPEQISAAIEERGAKATRLEHAAMVDATACEIAAGKIVGWFQGRMEFGPRALGNRSILADPRRPEMKDTLNKRIKFRESFRPFCPSILSERTGDWFETNYSSPFMVQAYKIRPEKREQIPAVVHEDGTGRLQTVEKDATPLYWELIHRFEELTGVPVIINTSFNENEPIVNTPAEALDCFLRTNMDVLVMGPYILQKADNPTRERT